MIQFFINLFSFNKAKSLVKANASVLNVFESTRKQLAENNQKMVAHQTEIERVIGLKQQERQTLIDTMITNQNVIANIEKIFTTT